MEPRAFGKLAWVAVHAPGTPRRYELNLGRRPSGIVEKLVLVEWPGSDRWRLGHQEGSGHLARKRVLGDGVTLEAAEALAEDHVRKSGASGLTARDAHWRKRGPTRRQRERLKKWEIDLPPGSTAGDASDLINAYIARRQHRKATT